MEEKLGYVVLVDHVSVPPPPTQNLVTPPLGVVGTAGGGGGQRKQLPLQLLEREAIPGILSKKCL